MLRFIEHFWPILEPSRDLVKGWVLEAICEHLEAVTRGQIKRLLMNVSPGSMKSLCANVFWPAWVWGPMRKPYTRFLAFSYAASLTWRDNQKFRDLMMSPEYKAMWGDVFHLVKIGEEKVTNDRTGFKLATSVGGVGTGERADIVVLDDAHNVKEAESDTVRRDTVRWFQESMSTRLNDDKSAIVVIGQRVHEEDVPGAIVTEGLPYEWLMIPMEYDPNRHCTTSIGWSDPRTVEGELAWPERFPPDALQEFKRRPYMWAAQFQQTPEPRGGGIFKRDWWQPWENPDDPDDPKYKTFPQFSYVFASLDTAFTEKEEADFSAFSKWGIFSTSHTAMIGPDGGRLIIPVESAAPKIMLIDAWKAKMQSHELAERVHLDCIGMVKKAGGQLRREKHPVSRLLIEHKANGVVVAQELARQFQVSGQYAVDLIDPGRQDKVARAYAVQHMWEQGMVWRPVRAWSDKVVDDLAIFPKGGRDMTDSCTQAIRHARDYGLLVRDDERIADLMASMKLSRPLKPLYPT